MKANKSVEKRYKLHNRKEYFYPFRVVNDEEFSRNMGAIIAYYQMTKGETKKRFISSDYYDNFERNELVQSLEAALRM